MKINTISTADHVVHLYAVVRCAQCHQPLEEEQPGYFTNPRWFVVTPGCIMGDTQNVFVKPCLHCAVVE